MRKRMKPAAAAVAAIMLAGSILPANAGAFSLLGTAITAHAAEAAGRVEGDTLYLDGEISVDFLRDNYWDNPDIKHIVAEETCVLPNNSGFLFYGYSGLYSQEFDESETDRWVNLESIDLSKADSTGLAVTEYMFANCESLKTITFGDEFDTSNVVVMAAMFYNCQSLEELDLSLFDTSNTINMDDMFRQCQSLKELDLSTFDTSKVTNMQCLFLECHNLEHITFGSLFNTSNVKSMPEFFDGCSSLKDIDLSGFDTSSAEDMYAMFRECSSLTELDLTTFDTSKVRDMCGMFSYCNNLETIRVSSLWSTESLETEEWGGAPNMFMDCAKLVGGNGTTYNESTVTDHRNYEYARIDGGREAPGYFTLGYPGNYIKGASIALDGYIGVTFWTVLSSKTAKAVLSGPNGDVEITDFKEWSANCHTSYDDPECVELIYLVNVLQPGEDILLRFFDADGKQLDVFNTNYEKQEKKEITYSVNRYINDAQRYIPTQFTYYEEMKETLLTAVNALDNYCKAASNYFKNTDYAVQGIADVTKTDFDEYEPTLCGNKMALVLDSGTAIRIYTDAESASYYGGGDTVQLEKNPDGYFEILNIPALYLGSTYTVHLNNDELSLSALSYGYLAMQLDANDPENDGMKVDELQTLVRALYVYAEVTSEMI